MLEKMVVSKSNNHQGIKDATKFGELNVHKEQTACLSRRHVTLVEELTYYPHLQCIPGPHLRP